jgi:hypothetical protein
MATARRVWRIVPRCCGLFSRDKGEKISLVLQPTVPISWASHIIASASHPLSGGDMTLRPEYALGHSKYNGFLYAVVDEEEIGLPLTVLTALTRLGLDPWQEAARLADLPRELAAQALAEVIARLPGKACKAPGSTMIAARLVKWLPARTVSAVPEVPAQSIEVSRVSEHKPQSRLATGLFWGGLGIAALFLMLHGQDDSNLEPAGRTNTRMEQQNR